jgi:hypothetical protein
MDATCSADSQVSAFGALDYVLFALFLLISLLIGVYHAWRAWQHRYGHGPLYLQSTYSKIHTETSNASKLMFQGDQQMPILPISLSLLTTFLSGVTLLGTPAEIYRRGRVDKGVTACSVVLTDRSQLLDLLLNGFIGVRHQRPVFHTDLLSTKSD